MNENGVCLFIGVIFAVMAVVLVVSYYQSQKRMQDLRALAERLGYRYSEKEQGLDRTLGEFALFSQGRGYSRRAANVLRGEAEGAALTCFDYAYTTGAGKSQHTTIQSVLLCESDRLNLPAFALRPEGFGQKLVASLGGQDIDFEEHPEFSAAYCLQGPDESRVRALFTPDKLAYFAARPRRCVEGNGRRLVCYRAGRRASTDEIESFIAEGLDVLRLLSAAPPDALAGLDEMLAEMGIEDGPAAGDGRP